MPLEVLAKPAYYLGRERRPVRREVVVRPLHQHEPLRLLRGVIEHPARFLQDDAIEGPEDNHHGRPDRADQLDRVLFPKNDVEIGPEPPLGEAYELPLSLDNVVEDERLGGFTRHEGS